MCIPCVTMPAPWVPTSMTVRTCRHQDCDHSMWLHNPSKTNRVELDADQYLCSCNNCQVVQDTWLEMCIAYRCAVSVTSDALCRRIASVNIFHVPVLGSVFVIYLRRAPLLSIPCRRLHASGPLHGRVQRARIQLMPRQLCFAWWATRKGHRSRLPRL